MHHLGSLKGVPPSVTVSPGPEQGAVVRCLFITYTHIHAYSSMHTDLRALTHQYTQPWVRTCTKSYIYAQTCIHTNSPTLKHTLTHTLTHGMVINYKTNVYHNNGERERIRKIWVIQTRKIYQIYVLNSDGRPSYNLTPLIFCS